MSARLAGDQPATPDALAARVRELQELLVAAQAKNDDLKVQLDGARQSVTEEQRANRDHALRCRVVHRPTSTTRDVPTGGLT